MTDNIYVEITDPDTNEDLGVVAVPPYVHELRDANGKTIWIRKPKVDVRADNQPADITARAREMIAALNGLGTKPALQLCDAVDSLRADLAALEIRMDVALANTDDLAGFTDSASTKLDRLIDLWRTTEDDLAAETASLQITAAAWGRNVRYSDEQRARAQRAEAEVALLTAEPRLGLATTRQLLDEITARIDVDYAMGGGGLDYSTVSGRRVQTPHIVDSGVPGVDYHDGSAE